MDSASFNDPWPAVDESPADWQSEQLPDELQEEDELQIPGEPHGQSEPQSQNDATRSALAIAQGIARGRMPSRSARRRMRQENLRGRSSPSGTAPRTGGYTGPGPDLDDPQPLGRVLSSYVDNRGWQRPLAEARVFAEWPALVGADVAAHCSPAALRDGELKVAAESTAWATQLRLLSSAMLARLVAELGPTVVTRLVITGPVAPSWKHGGLSVRGSRGPRDTYG